MPQPIHGAPVRARAEPFVLRLRAGEASGSLMRAAACVLTALAFTPAQAAPDRIAMGKAAFDRNCVRCHEIGIGAGNSIGPQLNGIIGAPAGIVPGYDYSTADRRSAVIWTREAFETFIEDPEADMPGTRMKGPDIASKEERAAIFAYVARFEANGAIRRAPNR